MRAINFLLPIVGALTLAYVAAALQIGPSTTDQNLCALLLRFGIDFDDQCSPALATGIKYGACCLALLLLGYWLYVGYQKLKPRGGRVVALGLIIVCGIGLVIGVALLYFEVGAKVQTVAGVGVTDVSNVNTPTARNVNSRASPYNFPIRSRPDAEREIPAIDDVLAFIRDDAGPRIAEGSKLSNNWENVVYDPSHNESYDADWQTFRSNLNAAAIKFAALKARYPEYFDGDISQITDTLDFENLSTLVGNLVAAADTLRDIVDHAKANRSSSITDNIRQLVAPHKHAADNSLSKYYDWCYDAKEALLNRRKDLSRIAAGQ